MQKHIQHNKDEQTLFYRKIYLSLYSKELSVRGELETEQNCNILTPPNSSGYKSISFPFSWAAQLGAWGPSLCWDMVLITVSFLPLIWTSYCWGYIIIWRPPTSCERHIHTQFNPSTVKVIPRYLRPDAPVIYTSAFLIWQPDQVGGQYATLYLFNSSLRIWYETRS